MASYIDTLCMRLSCPSLLLLLSVSLKKKYEDARTLYCFVLHVGRVQLKTNISYYVGTEFHVF